MIYSKDPISDNDPQQKREKDRWDIAMNTEHFERLLAEIKKNPLNSKWAKRDYMIFMLMGNLGLRIGEAALVKVGDVLNRINSDPPMIVTPSLKKRKKSKAGDRILPKKSIFVHPRVAKIVRQYMLEHAGPGQLYLFPGSSNEYKDVYGEYGHLSTRQIENVFYSYCRACGFKEAYSSHCLRHMYGSLVWQKTHDMAFLRDQLGHTVAKGMGAVTNLYVHIDPEHGRSLVKLVGCII